VNSSRIPEEYPTNQTRPTVSFLNPQNTSTAYVSTKTIIKIQFKVNSIFSSYLSLSNPNEQTIENVLKHPSLDFPTKMSSNDQSKFLENIKSKRAERHKNEEIKEKRECGAIVIQKTYRGWLARTKFRRRIM
jgi:hypothetical protein